MSMSTIQIGLERLADSPPEKLSQQRIGLLCNPASVDKDLRHARDIIQALFPGRLKALYSPQHGFLAEKQDNMIESADRVDPQLNIPIYSLYGHTRIPTREMFDPIDVLLVDLQDAGTRVYTFIYTLSYCLEAAKKYNKSVIVLDRPNPINGLQVEGNCLAMDCASFVGRYPLPMRHGLTIGELANLFNRHFDIGCRLKVIPMNGWKRAMFFTDTGRYWIPPSPNLPTAGSALVYPGQVLWEGTNISEGRGTTQPFEIFGAPFFEPEQIGRWLGESVPGAVLRPLGFEPTANKWKNSLCHGFQIHVIDPYHYTPYVTTLKLVQAARLLYKDQFQWTPPPYEYEYERMPIDLIIGDAAIRRRIENGEAVDDIAASWRPALDEFTMLSREFQIYS